MNQKLITIILYLHMLFHLYIGLAASFFSFASPEEDLKIVMGFVALLSLYFFYITVQFKRGKITVHKFWNTCLLLGFFALFIPTVTAAIVKFLYGKLNTNDDSVYNDTPSVQAEDSSLNANDQSAAAGFSIGDLIEKWSGFSLKEKILYGFFGFLLFTIFLNIFSSKDSSPSKIVNPAEEQEQATYSELYAYYKVTPVSLFEPNDISTLQIACAKAGDCIADSQARGEIGKIEDYLEEDNLTAAYFLFRSLNKEYLKGVPKSARNDRWFENYKYKKSKGWLLDQYESNLIRASFGESKSQKLKDFKVKYDRSLRSKLWGDDSDLTPAKKILNIAKAARELEAIVKAGYRDEQKAFVKQTKPEIGDLRNEKDPERAFQSAVALLKKYPYYVGASKTVNFKRLKERYVAYLETNLNKELTSFSKSGSVENFDKELKEFLQKTEPARVNDKLTKKILKLRVDTHNTGFVNSQQGALQVYEESYQPDEYREAIGSLAKQFPFSDKLQLVYADYYFKNNEDLVNEAKAMIKIKKRNQPADYDRLLKKMSELAELSGQQADIVTLYSQVQQAHFYTRVLKLNSEDYNPDEFNSLYEEIRKTHSADKELETMYLDYFKTQNSELLKDADKLIKKYRTSKPEDYPGVISDMKELSEKTENHAYFTARLEKLNFLNDIFSLPNSEKYKAIEVSSCRCYYPSRKSRTATCVLKVENFSEKKFKGTGIRVIHKDKKERPVDLAYLYNQQVINRFSKATLTIRNATFPRETKKQECSLTNSGVI